VLISSITFLIFAVLIVQRRSKINRVIRQNSLQPCVKGQRMRQITGPVSRGGGSKAIT